MVKELGDHEALELFSMHAFKQNKPEEDYLELTNQVICYAKGFSPINNWCQFAWKK